MLKYKIIVVLLVAVTLAVVADKIIFSTTTVSVESNPQRILVGSSSPVEVEVVPLNRLGFNVPFDHLSGKFVVRQGGDKINVVRAGQNKFVFTPGTTAGKVVIFFYASNLAFPVEIVLRIESASIASVAHSSGTCA